MCIRDSGYKVYWQDGAQLPPHHAEAIAKKMEELDFFASIKRMDYDEAVEKGLITVMGAETDEKFLSNVMGQVNDKAAVEKVEMCIRDRRSRCHWSRG